MNTHGDGLGRSETAPPVRERGLRQAIGDRIQRCREELDNLADLVADDGASSGPIPAEARAFFAFEAARDLALVAWQAKRAEVSCGKAVSHQLPGPWSPEPCTLLPGHKGGCDMSSVSGAEQVERDSRQLSMAMEYATYRVAHVALRIDQEQSYSPAVSADALASLVEVREDLETIANDSRGLLDRMRRLESELTEIAARSVASPTARLDGSGVEVGGVADTVGL